jgi:TrwC relaxase
VLSVWKLAAGQEAYYLNSVARGVEDYYLGGEAPGRWIASSGRMLGLSGRVESYDLHLVLAGRDPSTATRLGQPHTVPGFDLTFRAPKSVSVLFGLGDPVTAVSCVMPMTGRWRLPSSSRSATSCGPGAATPASTRSAVKG